MILGPLKLGGRSHINFYFPQETHQLRYFPQNKKPMASSTTQEDGRQKTINFCWG
jgi:hypothetical protein